MIPTLFAVEFTYQEAKLLAALRVQNSIPRVPVREPTAAGGTPALQGGVL